MLDPFLLLIAIFLAIFFAPQLDPRNNYVPGLADGKALVELTRAAMAEYLLHRTPADNQLVPLDMQALVATMRKLLHAIFGMFKHDQLFDGQKLYASTSPTLAPVPSNSEVVCAQT